MKILSIIKQKLYRKIVRTKWYKHLIDVDKKKALDIFYFQYLGIHINWDNPRSLNEKIMWLSIYSDTSLWSKYSDKYEVRDYVEKKGFGKYLTKIYGVWDNINQIDYDALPSSFVIKCTHDSHSTYIIKDKSKLDKTDLNKKLSNHLKELYGYRYCEPHSNCIRPRIIAEELLIQEDVSFSSTMVDYKFICVNSKVEYCLVCYDRSYDDRKPWVMREIYSVNPWRPNYNAMSKLYLNQVFKKQVPEPKNLQTMIQMAEKLSIGFPVVRVDLYNDNGRIYFGELTFTPAGGRMTCFSDDVQLELGNKISVRTEANTTS